MAKQIDVKKLSISKPEFHYALKKVSQRIEKNRKGGGLK